MALKRVSEEPAYVLHRYDWSESSLILELFCRQHGRVAMAAKGVKKPTSQFRPVLLPLQPLLVGWTGEGEVRNLRSASWRGGHVMPSGEALLSGCYLNELLLRFLARDDPYAALFDQYAMAVRWLAEQPQAQQPMLRAFEMLLLQAVGFLPDLAHEASSLSEVLPEAHYLLVPDSGLQRSAEDHPHALLGQHCLDMQAALEGPEPMPQLLRVLAHGHAALRQPLRQLLHYHGAVRVFKTRQLMLDVQALGRRARPQASADAGDGSQTAAETPLVSPQRSAPQPNP